MWTQLSRIQNPSVLTPNKVIDLLCTYVHNELMRPKKTRWIKCNPDERCFRPKDVPIKELNGVSLTLDEFEAIRLIDLEGCDQVAVSKMMKVHRSTVSRILNSARKKIAGALVNIKAIKIEGGCCKIKKQGAKES